MIEISLTDKGISTLCKSLCIWLLVAPVYNDWVSFSAIRHLEIILLRRDVGHQRAVAMGLISAVPHLNPGGHLIVLSPAYQFLYSFGRSFIGIWKRV